MTHKSFEQIAKSMYAAYAAAVREREKLYPTRMWIHAWRDLDEEMQQAWQAAARAAYKEFSEGVL